MARILNNFEVIPATGEEEKNPALSPEETACRLAENKCDEVFSKTGGVVIGCDTVVVYDGKVLGKPESEDDAEQTLKMLSGKTHYVITGVCVRSPYKKVTDYEFTEVTFNTLSPEFIKSYVKGGSPMDKAGSYGIQDEGVVKNYHGSYTNVVGLPVALVKKMIEEVINDDAVGN